MVGWVCVPCAGRGWVYADPYAFERDESKRLPCERCGGRGEL